MKFEEQTLRVTHYIKEGEHQEIEIPWKTIAERAGSGEASRVGNAEDKLCELIGLNGYVPVEMFSLKAGDSRYLQFRAFSSVPESIEKTFLVLMSLGGHLYLYYFNSPLTFLGFIHQHVPALETINHYGKAGDWFGLNIEPAL